MTLIWLSSRDADQEEKRFLRNLVNEGDFLVGFCKGMDNNEEVYVKKLFFDISTISDAFPLSIVIKFMQLISFLLFVITFLDYSIKLFILDLIFNILFKNKFSAMKKPPATFYLSTHEKD